MFSELDTNGMIGHNKCLRQLFLAAFTVEEAAPYEYGVFLIPFHLYFLTPIGEMRKGSWYPQ